MNGVLSCEYHRRMDAVYLLWHTHESKGQEPDEKLLGVYSTEEKAARRIEAAKQLPGFREASAGFEVARYVIDRDEWTEGFLTL